MSGYKAAGVTIHEVLNIITQNKFLRFANYFEYRTEEVVTLIKLKFLEGLVKHNAFSGAKMWQF
jgi:hypothetical protein